jgi:hypothetical protein
MEREARSRRWRWNAPPARRGCGVPRQVSANQRKQCRRTSESRWGKPARSSSQASGTLAQARSSLPVDEELVARTDTVPGPVAVPLDVFLIA